MTARHRRNTEPYVNGIVARALDRRHPLWKAGSEQTRTIAGQPGKRPDILLEHRNGGPVIIEAELEPASRVEREARARLGVALSEGGGTVEHVVALRLPGRLAEINQGRLPEAVEENHAYRFASWSLDREGSPIRWPAQGWLRGGMDDLANLCENIAISEQALAAGLSQLEQAVSQIAYRLRRELRPARLAKMAEALHQEDGEQTSRMAAAIIVNAMVFHNAIALHSEIPATEDLRRDGIVKRNLLHKQDILECWRDILDINYWPIFHLAISLLRPIPVPYADEVATQAAQAATALDGLGVTTMHDLSGRMFQQLIADRKFLATFYTLPASAAMMAELACSQLAVDWADPAAVKGLRIADLACGTGALLSAAYQSVRSRHRRAGGDDQALHAPMIEHSLIAADVMPAAAHLTASQLASAHPGLPFGNTRVHTMAYGNSDGAGPKIGSLELLDKNSAQTLFETGSEMTHGRGQSDQAELHLSDSSLDLMIMNPPFTRPTNHESAIVPRPDFAGLGNDPNTQRQMGVRLKAARKALDKSVGDGNAGLGSDFADLAHVKLKEGGALALVLPFTLIAGQSWRKLRELLASDYANVTIISIAASSPTDRAFSADTGMADMVITAVKNTGQGDGQARFVNLYRRPESLPEAMEIARLIRQSLPDKEKSGFLEIGDHPVGVWLQESIMDGKGVAGIAEPGLATTMTALADNNLLLPRGHEHVLFTTTLSQLGERGLVSRDIGAKPQAGGEIRGPFEVRPLSGVPEYPLLWNHNAKRERRLVVEPDSSGRVRKGRQEDATKVWQTATRLHFNHDFRLNSQSLAACLTQKPAIGGTAWPSFKSRKRSWEIPLLLWANTTLGLMSFWWVGTLQQQGRARLSITALPDLPVLDPRRLTPIQLKKAERIFNELVGLEFLPANEAYRDQARRQLDREVLVNLLGLPEEIMEPLDVLRRQWCSEPSVHGGKSTRPDSARFREKGAA